MSIGMTIAVRTGTATLEIDGERLEFPFVAAKMEGGAISGRQIIDTACNSIAEGEEIHVAIRKAVVAEREACIEIVQELCDYNDNDYSGSACDAVEQIRERGIVVGVRA